MSGITPDTVTPDKLRAAAKVRNATWLPVLASCGPMFADAMEISDLHTRTVIESNCLGVSTGDDLRWYDTRVVEVCEIGPIAQAVRYLESRKLIERHPEHNEWVRMVEP